MQGLKAAMCALTMAWLVSGAGEALATTHTGASAAPGQMMESGQQRQHDLLSETDTALKELDKAMATTEDRAHRDAMGKAREASVRIQTLLKETKGEVEQLGMLARQQTRMDIDSVISELDKAKASGDKGDDRGHRDGMVKAREALVRIQGRLQESKTKSERENQR